MDIRAVCNNFQRTLPDQPGPLPPADGLGRFLQFYRERQVDRCLPDDDGDVLVFQWGTYDWGDGERFEVSLTRELLTAAGDGAEELRQVALTYRFAPEKALHALGDGELWCDDPTGAEKFWARVLKAKPFQAVAGRADGEMELGEGEA